MTIVSGLLPQKPVPELRGAVDAALLGGADPYPDLPSLPFAQPPLLLVPEFKVGQLQNLVQYSLVVAAVVEVPVGDKVRELLWLDEVLAPELDRVHSSSLATRSTMRVGVLDVLDRLADPPHLGALFANLGNEVLSSCPSLS
jgi:hypothetical protein